MTKVKAAEIGAEGIGKTFGTFAALKDVSLTIGRGEFLTLLGPFWLWQDHLPDDPCRV